VLRFTCVHTLSVQPQGMTDSRLTNFLARPDPGPSPNPKDDVELQLHDLVCRGTVPITIAQQAIATDWTTAVSVVSGN
jgi:hypothetical protein